MPINSAKVDEINQMMALVAAELDSSHAKHPSIASNSSERKLWVVSQSKTSTGEPFFVQGPGKYKPSMKDDCVCVDYDL